MRELILDAEALKHNLQQVKIRAPKSKVLAMVKANAYGHGLAWAAKHLHAAGANGFGVASLNEAKIVRELNLNLPIVLMAGVQTLADLKLAIAENFTIVVSSEHQLSLLEQIKTNHSLNIWLKIDTGMHRMGFFPEQLKSVWGRLEKLKFINQPIVLMTHFSDANEVKQPTTARQLMIFNLARATLPESIQFEASLANSAGILSWPETHADWVRPGIMLYGASPFEAYSGNEHGLKPVMTVKSRVIAINNVASGAAIGYGGTFICPKAMRIAVVAFGYGDGYPRHAELSEVLIKNHRCQVVGRISMDMLQVDISHFADITIDDEVTLWGEGLDVESLAVASETIPYEIFCHLQRHRLTVR